MSQSTKSGRKVAELGLPTLEERRHQADMTMVHKIINGRGELDPLQWFEAGSERVTRSSANPLNLRMKHVRMELRRNFFSVRVIDSWNAIPSYVRVMSGERINS